MESIVIFGLLLAVLAAGAPFLYALRKRSLASADQLEFWRVLQRRGLSAADAAAKPVALGAALRRCTFCPSVDACTEWLASPADERLDEFCPNAYYLKELERR